MPIYEYQCAACGHVLEALQKIGEAPMVDCPVCNKAELQKLVSASSFQLKGTGWYATDFKTKPQAAQADAKTDEKTAASSDTNTTAAPAQNAAADTKTATVSDTKTDKSS
jgi:putative FmdB family regulatory protein